MGCRQEWSGMTVGEEGGGVCAGGGSVMEGPS